MPTSNWPQVIRGEGVEMVIDEPTVLMGISFEVRGVPVTQGSMRAAVSRYGTPYVQQDHRSNLVAWRHAVNDEVRDAFAMRVAFDGEVTLTLHFYLPRPKGHFGTGRNAGVLKDSAPRRPTGKPDLDKLVRAVMDAVKGVGYKDDAQVVSLRVDKWYATDTRQPGLVGHVAGAVVSSRHNAQSEAE